MTEEQQPVAPAGRPVRREYVGEVLRVGELTRHMVRVVLGGAGLADFQDNGFADQYVKLVFDEDVPEGERAPLRTYTVRSWDPEAVELTLDVVVHGHEGLGGRWAAGAEPGDRVTLRGPGGAYTPGAGYDWHLLIGDESALPAIAVALERIPEGVPVTAFVEVPTLADEQFLTSLGALDLHWVHRWPHEAGERLVHKVQEATRPEGRGQVFLHGEAGFVRDLRRWLRSEWGIAAADLSASGYWRLGRTDEAWRAEKKAWVEAVAADDASLEG